MLEEVRSSDNFALDCCAAEVEVERWPSIEPATVVQVSWKPSLADLTPELALVSSE